LVIFGGGNGVHYTHNTGPLASPKMKESDKMAKKVKKHYVDNKKFLEEIVEYKRKCAVAAAEGLEKPMISEYIGKCIKDIAEHLSTKPLFINYTYRDEMISDAIENCFLYFDNFDPAKSENPFAYFTQISYYAFQRRKSNEKKNRYIIYKKFQESVLDTDDAALMVDSDGTHLISSSIYDNINDFIKDYEEREHQKKMKRKEKKEGLEKFVGDDNEGRESV
jgi:hypothetical protein